MTQALKFPAIPIMVRLGIIALLSSLLAACGTAAGQSSGTLQVIAGENFWGSIAAQLGGSKVSVTSIVTNPNTDPHDYESSATDARAFAAADYVVVNGAGYDDWAQKLLSANPNDHRKVMTVATLVNKKEGDNPHLWYNPDWIDTVADRITADYKALDSADSSYFSEQRSKFRTALQPYRDLIARIRANDSGVQVGATESIFVYLAQALGLNLVSPPEFMVAISEGDDPPAQTVAQFQNQIAQHQVKLLAYNRQASSPITENVKQLASRNNIPIVGISETVEPANASFQDWQVAQLTAIEAALSRK
jgi:zinc/manganese transport system substrate-binding protein